MITATQYTRTFESWRKILRDESVRITRSGETRAWLMKNLGTAPDGEVIRRAVECIADLTGDECLRKKVRE